MKMTLPKFGFKWIIYFTMTLLLFPRSVEALEIHDIRWGFGDRPVAYKINPVTILIENTESKPFESELRLQRKTLRGEQIDIALSASVYIAPFEKKWLQFYPYLTESTDNWEVSWKNENGQSSQSFLSPRPIVKPLKIQLAQPDRIGKVVPGIKQFPEDLFPPILGAVDSLNEIILDHVPKWEKSRRNAFLQWIYSGGVVHLFENSNGNLPTFPESYASLKLNQTSSPVHYGNGVIYFYHKKLDEITFSELKQMLVKNIKSVGEQQAREETKYNLYQRSNFSYNQLPENFIQSSITDDEELLVALNELSKTKQIWYFIFLISFFYLIVTGPGYYFITKFSANHYLFYGIYLGSTALFCLIFLIIGEYSANSTSRIHSLIIANLLPDNELDITEWSCLGIASGGNFNISHPGNSHIYSTCQHFSKVNGTVINGREGKMVVDIPTNSSRSFFHRGKISASSFSVQVNSFLSSEMKLEVLALEIDKYFPAEVDQIHFLYGSKLYKLHQEGNQLVFRGAFRKLSSLLGENTLLDQKYFAPAKPTSFLSLQDQTKDLSLNHFFPILLQRVLSRSSRDSLHQYRAPNNHGKLFVLGEIPDNLFLNSPEVTKKEGLVLYCLDIPLTSRAG